MQKRHFERMAEMVRFILTGHWTMEFPPWADESQNCIAWHAEDGPYTRAVWTAEAFIKLAADYNPRFDRTRFLQACGLMEKPAKKGRAK